MTIKVFIGTAANHEDAESQAVLEWSIRKHTNSPVDITWMKLSRDPDSPFYSDKQNGWQTKQWATPFSGFRWGIPAWCDYTGRGIYMDSDIIVMADIAELWNQQFKPGKMVMAKGGKASWRYCVSMWDCEAANKIFPPQMSLMKDMNSHRRMQSTFSRSPRLVQAFEGNWNCLDGEDYDDLNDPDIKAIHYTAMRHQPQLKHALPRLKAAGKSHWFDGVPQPHWRDDLQELFDGLLIEAEANGYGIARYIQDPEFGEYTKLKVGSVGQPTWTTKIKKK